MINIGILFPGSTLYPSIGIDFIQGIRSCFNHDQFADFQLHLASAGYGLLEAEIYKETEKFILNNNADVVVLYAEDTVAARLLPLFSTTGKLLIVVNSGANYSTAFPAGSPIISLSLHDCVCSFLTGKLLAQSAGSSGVIAATSFYDGGYCHTHAMTAAFTLAGKEVKYNFITPFKLTDLNTEALEEFIENNKEVRKIAALFSGEMTRGFLGRVSSLQKKYKIEIFGCPMMFDSSPGDFQETEVNIIGMKGYTSWIPQLDTEANNSFKVFYKNENHREVNMFSLQGWETALLLQAYSEQIKTSASREIALQSIRNKPLASPRGLLKLNETNTLLSPVYEVEANGNMEIEIKNTVDDISSTLQEMSKEIPQGHVSNWRNTYLCI